jgi:3' terminal RNA ribose 2'-O-methyltransferase Hen1
VTVLLTITCTGTSAVHLSHLLHKHPGRVQTYPVSGGAAHVFYPESTPERCTVALLVEVDPVELVRGRRGSAAEGFALGGYVNDRPYAASSLLAVALRKVFATAARGRSADRQSVADSALPLRIRIPALPCRDGADLVRRVFGPLGWLVDVAETPLDPQFPSWGPARCLDVTLTGEVRLANALMNLYVMLPVLDDAKHYWVTTDEVEKLVAAGGEWLATHPERELITRRYLAHQRDLTRTALARLAEVDDTEPEELDHLPEPDVGPSLNEQRRAAVLAAVSAAGARTVGDLGCGEGALVADLAVDRSIEAVVATDVSVRALQATQRRLLRLGNAHRERVRLFQSSLTYRDDRIAGLDAAVLMEVIEHIDPSRLTAMEQVVFGHAAPATVLVTTPNADHNVRFATLPAGHFRHHDHRFEWTRAQLRDWADRVADRFGYTPRFLPVGADDPEVGPPTQLAIFSRAVAA